MLGFETLTFAPIDRRLIEVSMLDPEELVWLNCYHAHVLAKIGAKRSITPIAIGWQGPARHFDGGICSRYVRPGNSRERTHHDRLCDARHQQAGGGRQIL